MAQGHCPPPTCVRGVITSCGKIRVKSVVIMYVTVSAMKQDSRTMLQLF